MQTRRCGRHDLELPVLGLGCWAFGGGEYWGPQSQGNINEVVRTAVAHGCTYFDTAEVYNGGASEAALGVALTGVPRGQVVIGTKISPSNVRPGRIAPHCEASLRRLRTDYIDLYLVHWPITPHAMAHFTTEAIEPPPVAEAFAELDRLRKDGKVRHLGVSNFGTERLAEALATGVPIVANELPCSLLTRAIEFETAPFCEKNGVGVLGYMSLLQGVLGGSYASFDELPEWRCRTRHFSSRRSPHCRHGEDGFETETQAALQEIQSIARHAGATVADLALRWAIGRPGVTTSLCGARNLEQLRQNLAAAEAPLEQELVRKLDRATQPLRDAMGASFDYYESPANDRTR